MVPIDTATGVSIFFLALGTYCHSGQFDYKLRRIKKLHSFIELPFIWLNTLKFVERSYAPVYNCSYAKVCLCTWCVQVLRSPTEAFAAAMQSWRERYEKCVCLQGDYVEK